MIDQTDNIETLNEIMGETQDRMRSNASETNPDVKRRLEFRVLEIRDLMLTVLKFNSKPPLIKDVPEHMRIMEDVKRRIEGLKSDPLGCGRQIINLGS